MKRTVPLLLAVLLLAGCSAQSPEDAYVSAVTAEAPNILERGTKQELVELGTNACEYIDGGMSQGEAADRITDSGIPESESTAVVAAAVGSLCP